jgi:hypothetical protein
LSALNDEIHGELLYQFSRGLAGTYGDKSRDELH